MKNCPTAPRFCLKHEKKERRRLKKKSIRNKNAQNATAETHIGCNLPHSHRGMHLRFMFATSKLRLPAILKHIAIAFYTYYQAYYYRMKDFLLFPIAFIMPILGVLRGSTFQKLTK